MSPSSSRLAWAVWVVGVLCMACVSLARARPDQVYEARVTKVSDGDTVWVQPLAGGAARKLRFLGLDAPEICQAGGQAARDALARRVFRKVVTVRQGPLDDYGRGLAHLTHEGQDVGGWLVATGQAWSYRWRHSDGPYRTQEAQARAAGLGLFADPQAERPRLFRRRHGPCERPWPSRP